MAGNTGLVFAVPALVGFAAGLTVRLPALLFLLALLLVLSIFFALSYGLGFLDTAVNVAGTQTIVQICYFVGLVTKAAVGSRRLRNL